MKNENDRDLSRLFTEMGEPPHGEIFVERVTRRIALLRYAQRVMQIFLAFAGAAFLAVLTPWLIDLTGSIALVSNLFADSVVVVSLSPFFWIVGLGAGMFLFLKTH